jgi:ADP-ribosylglycohydrolase
MSAGSGASQGTVASMNGERAAHALDGLSVGDAFGERFFGSGIALIESRGMPASPWRWTDDTAMALGIMEELHRLGHIDRDALARVFARRWYEQPARGYGAGAHRILEAIHQGAPWWSVSRSAFGREGSKGNGAAMRVAPLGAVALLGNGSEVTAPDTVPFSLWCATRHLNDFSEALWETVSGRGDRDTTCAIVGGIVAAAGTVIPPAWLAAREPLKLNDEKLS